MPRSVLRFLLVIICNIFDLKAPPLKRKRKREKEDFVATSPTVTTSLATSPLAASSLGNHH